MGKERDLSGIIMGLPFADMDARDFLFSVKQVLEKTVFVILSETPPPPESVEEFKKATPFIYSLDQFTIPTLLPILINLFESVQIKEKGEKFIKIIRHENLISAQSDFGTDDLANHITILESWKKEAEKTMLILEEENLKLKNELMEVKDDIRRSQAAIISGKYKGVITKSHSTSAAHIGANSLDFTPLQKIASTVSKISKVVDKLDQADIKTVLSGVASTLATGDLYTPSGQLIEQMDLDEETKDYLLTMFTQHILTRRKLHQTEGGRRETSENGLVKIVRKRVHNLEETVFKFDYKIWSFTTGQLTDAIVLSFDTLGFYDKFEIPFDNATNFVNALITRYNDEIPYHNFRHVFDVFQLCFLFVTKSKKVKNSLTPADQFCLLLSALCHDMCHPGTSNSFHINSHSDLALQYNDISVLENYHTFQTFSLLKEENCDLFTNLSTSDKKHMRKSIVAAILATDMTHHFELVGKFSTMLDTKESTDNWTEPQERQLLINTLLHTADISNLGRSPEIAKKWSGLVFEEFLLQGDKEKELGIPISPYMNRQDPNQPKMILNFIDFVVTPLFSSFVRLLPEFEVLQTNVNKNRKIWGEEKERLLLQQIEEHTKDPM
jgi:hypothetical protein